MVDLARDGKHMRSDPQEKPTVRHLISLSRSYTYLSLRHYPHRQAFPDSGFFMRTLTLSGRRFGLESASFSLEACTDHIALP